jgi:hypothetical protein
MLREPESGQEYRVVMGQVSSFNNRFNTFPVAFRGNSGTK